MTNEIKLTRTIAYENGECSIPGLPAQKLEITIDGDATLDEMLDVFNDFLKGAGYYPPTNSQLEYVSNDTEEKCCSGDCGGCEDA